MSGAQGRRVRRLHQHDAGRGVSRRRPAGSDVHARADDRRPGAQAAPGSGRGPQAQPDSGIRQRPRRRHRPEVRQRQLPGRARQGADARRIRDTAPRAGGGAREAAATSVSASRPTSRSVASARRRSPARSDSRAVSGRAPSSVSTRAARSTSSSARRHTGRERRPRSRRSWPTRSASP